MANGISTFGGSSGGERGLEEPPQDASCVHHGAWARAYFAISSPVGVTVGGAASEIEKVSQVFPPDGRLAASNSP